MNSKGSTNDVASRGSSCPAFSVKLRILRASVVCLSLALGAVADAATIHLKDGKDVVGEIVERTDKELKVKLASGKVQTIKTSDIKSIDEPPLPPPPVVSNETGDAPVDTQTKQYERWLDRPLATAVTELTVVRGDHPLTDLKRMSEATEKTARHFLQTFGAQPEEVLRGDRYGQVGRVQVFQFIKEEAYLNFCDKVLARIRDTTVDDARLAFMRRQRGFWIVTPRPMLAQYQGPSDFVTSVSAAVHKVSHEMLDLWKPAEHNGTFRGNNHAFVTATAAIEAYWSTDAFADSIKAKGEHLRRRLQAMVDRFSPDLVDVRGRGMMIGVRCADPARAAAVTKRAYQYGLIIERAGPDDEVIKCMMPLTTTVGELDEGLDILERAIAEEFGGRTIDLPKAA